MQLMAETLHMSVYNSIGATDAIKLLGKGEAERKRESGSPNCQPKAGIRTEKADGAAVANHCPAGACEMLLIVLQNSWSEECSQELPQATN